MRVERTSRKRTTRPLLEKKLPRGGATSSAHPGRRPFVEPELARHEPLTRITLVSDFTGTGSGQGTFFG